jgi:hypothetical protein
VAPIVAAPKAEAAGTGEAETSSGEGRGDARARTREAALSRLRARISAMRDDMADEARHENGSRRVAGQRGQ